MKKILLIAFILPILTFTTHAQIKKGSFLLGSDISFSSAKSESQYTTSQQGFSLSPILGKAIKENLIVGGFAGIIFNKTKSSAVPDGVAKSNTYSAGVFVRKYKQLGGNGFHFFLEGNAGYATSKYTNNNSNPVFETETNISVMAIGVKPGIAFAICDKVHLETGLNNILSVAYSWGNESRNDGFIDSDYKISGFGFHSSLNNATSNLYVGFRVFLGK